MARLIRPDGDIVNGIPHRSVEDMRRTLGCNVEMIRFTKKVHRGDDTQPEEAEFLAFVDVDMSSKNLPINEKATLVVEREIRGSAIITSDSELGS